MKQEQPESTARRGFLKTIATAGAGASVTTLLPSAVIAAEPAEEEQPAANQGYQVTSHVIDYYKSATI